MRPRTRTRTHKHTATLNADGRAHQAVSQTAAPAQSRQAGPVAAGASPPSDATACRVADCCHHSLSCPAPPARARRPPAHAAARRLHTPACDNTHAQTRIDAHTCDTKNTYGPSRHLSHTRATPMRTRESRTWVQEIPRAPAAAATTAAATTTVLWLPTIDVARIVAPVLASRRLHG
jgi:hypothetical protein